MFSNWELKSAHGSTFLLASCILVSVQQLDWKYCASVVIWIYLTICAVHALKAPKQCFKFYYKEDLVFESFDQWGSLVVFHTCTLCFGLTMLYQITKLRRKQFASLITLDVLRQRERQVATNEISAQRARIDHLEESWRIDEDEIVCDALIATGGAGQVWRGRLARQNEEEKVVAVKKFMMSSVYHDDDRAANESHRRSSSEDHRGGFRLWEDSEINVLMRLRHERLVSFLGAGESTAEGVRFMVVELMTGGSIEKMLWGTSPTSLTTRTRLVWATDVALGMGYIHSRGFLHRDLKTPNILFDRRSMRAKVADFGLGKFLEPSATTTSTSARRDPTTTTISTWDSASMTGNAGSVLWMAPEVMKDHFVQDAEYGQAVDVYAFSIVMWELVSHEMPWEKIAEYVRKRVVASNLTEAIFSAVKAKRRPEITETMRRRVGMDEAYFTLMRECWAHDPADRPRFERVRQVLSGLLQDEVTEEKVRRRSRRSVTTTTRPLGVALEMSEMKTDEEEDGVSTKA